MSIKLLNFGICDNVSYVMFQNNFDFIRNAVIQNNDNLPLGKFTISIESDVDFLDPIIFVHDGIGPNETVNITKELNEKVVLKQEFFLSITEKTKSVVMLKFFIDGYEQPLKTEKFETEVLPFNYWPGVNSIEMLASFITPNAESVKTIRSAASEQLKKWGKDPSLEGYQKNDRNRVLDLAAAVYAAFKSRNINYVLPPAEFESAGQRIRFVDDVLNDYEGTCIDLSVAYASVLESIGINTLIFITRNHAFAGFWLSDDCMSNIVNYDNNNYVNLVKNNEMMLVECTCLTNSYNYQFKESNNLALTKLMLDEDFVCGLDVKKSRSVYRPLPIRKKVGDQWIIERSEADNYMEAPDDAGTIYGDVDERSLTREDKWKRELLDITSRNNLINMKMGSKVLPIMTTELSELQNKLIGGKRLIIVEKPQEWDGNPVFQNQCFESENYISNYVLGCSEDLSRNRLRTPLSYADMLKIEKSIYRLSNKELEESGCNALFVGLGLLKWRDQKNIFHYSPLILIPVSIRKTRNNDFTIELLDEDIVFNITIEEKLRQEFGISIPNFDPLTTDSNGCVNIEEIFQNVTRAINGKGWTVLNSCVLGIFSFSQYVMWKDLDSNMGRLKTNPIVNSLVDGVTYPAQTPIEYSSDPCGLCLTMPADSSQIVAVRAASEGKTFVMHGPPGTGKSQTITNIISDSLSKGKTVLFVAEKRAALEVVQKRLNEIGIGDSCLELHSNKSEKTKVMEQLRRAIGFRYNLNDNNKLKTIESEITKMQSGLDTYVSELHKQRYCGLSVYDCICRYESYHSKETIDFKIPSSRITWMDPGDDIEFSRLLNAAYNAYINICDLKETSFKNIGFNDVSVTAYEKAVGIVDGAYEISRQIRKKIGYFSQFGLPFSSDDPGALLEYFAILNSDSSKLFRDRDYDKLKDCVDSLKDWFQLLKTIVDSSYRTTASNKGDLLHSREELFDGLDSVDRYLEMLQDDPRSINDSVKEIRSLVDRLYRNHEEITEMLKTDTRLTINSLYEIINKYDPTLIGDPEVLSEQFEEVKKYLAEVKGAIVNAGLMGDVGIQHNSLLLKNLIEQYEGITSKENDPQLKQIQEIVSWNKSVEGNLSRIIKTVELKAEPGTAIDENYLTRLNEVINNDKIGVIENNDVGEVLKSLDAINTTISSLAPLLENFDLSDYDTLVNVMNDVSLVMGGATNGISEVSQSLDVDCKEPMELYQSVMGDYKNTSTFLSEVLSVFKGSVFTFYNRFNVEQEWEKASHAGFFRKKKAKQQFLTNVSSQLRNPSVSFDSLKVVVYELDQIRPKIIQMLSNIRKLGRLLKALSKKYTSLSNKLSDLVIDIKLIRIPVHRFAPIVSELKTLFIEQNELIKTGLTTKSIDSAIIAYGSLKGKADANKAVLSRSKVDYSFVADNYTKLSGVISEGKGIVDSISSEMGESSVLSKIIEMSKIINDLPEKLENIGLDTETFVSTYDDMIGTTEYQTEYRKLLSDYDTAIEDVKDVLIMPQDYDLKEEFDTFYEEFELVKDKLTDWAIWNDSTQELRENDLEGAIRLIENGMDRELLINSMFTSLYRTMIDLARSESEVLRSFNSDSFESLIKDYKKKDLEYTAFNRKYLKYKLARNVPNSGSTITGSEEYTLHKAINAKRMRKSIRTLLGEIPNLLPKICPCLLMSPQSVAQYITMDYPKFDIVIFDESSQIITSKAIGTLGRGNSTIIAGDSKQLPPTTFFHKKMEIITEDDDMVDIDSFLDDCIALNMPQTYLEWHYRSTHESLISFSNRMFYDNKMLTFPSPNDRETKVSMRFIENGSYNGTTRCNEAEADAIARDIYRRVMNEGTHDQSIGVVAFSSAQQKMIEDKLDEYFERYEDFYNQFSTVPEGVFIKNLETVQGDERDVILFSIGYGPSKDRKRFIQNFGPINQAGGGRRLNVAVSRARKEMVVFSSIKYSDVKISATSSQGVVAFREFLHYAESRGRFTEDLTINNSDVGTGLIDDIVGELSKKGYECRTEVGLSEYKVDIAVVDPDNPSNYLLGILLDGDSYRSSNNTRDREYARSDVLTRLGWNLMHVWSMEWFYRKGKTMHGILTRLEKLKNGEELADDQIAYTEEEPETEEEDEYVEAPISREYNPIRFVSNEMPLNYRFLKGTCVRNTIKMVGSEIVRRESPINEYRLLEIYASSFEGNVTKERKNIILRAFREMTDVYIEFRDGQRTYWRNSGQRVGYDKYGQYKKIDEVPIVEMENAILFTLKCASSIPKDNLITETARKLGFDRTGPRIKEALEEVIEILQREGKIELKGDRLIAV